MVGDYNGSLTREQFLFYETRIVAALLQQGLSRDEVLERIRQENLFQFPTERMISSIANTCFKMNGLVLHQIFNLGFSTYMMYFKMHSYLGKRRTGLNLNQI